MALSLSWQLIKRTKPEVGVIQGGWDSIFECRGVSPRGGSVNVSGAARPRWQEKWLSRKESHFCRYWEMWLIDNKPKNLNQIQYQNPVSWDMELGAGLGHTQARLKVTGQIIGIYPINRTSVKNLSIFILYHHQPWNFKQRIPTFVRPSVNRTQMFLLIVFFYWNLSHMNFRL